MQHHNTTVSSRLNNIQMSFYSNVHVLWLTRDSNVCTCMYFKAQPFCSGHYLYYITVTRIITIFDTMWLKFLVSSQWSKNIQACLVTENVLILQKAIIQNKDIRLDTTCQQTGEVFLSLTTFWSLKLKFLLKPMEKFKQTFSRISTVPLHFTLLHAFNL